MRETRLDPAHLVAPLFVEAGEGVRTPIAALPGQHRFSPDTVTEEAARLAGLGVGGVILFGVPPTKDATGTSGWSDQTASRTRGRNEASPMRAERTA